ncbi:cupin domain-containing protein [Echinicola jeungdonensis]|uniref:Cupin domain-containing protein n=1 Tax=Echinicola jeungdonensis TaxID=709343 RepID=A0ABV5J364_9BACT|nr:cupin domain-containing protein [Echinicola jeungdonensis]MDN3667993.1 cupin domain-containing protein [Echinicola jeungdonensis]
MIISYVEIPKNTTLPYHYHPGEEFAYLLHGSGDLYLKGNEQKNIKAGQAEKVPLKAIHSFTSGNEGAKMVVFRVHQQGQPDRIMVGEDKE